MTESSVRHTQMCKLADGSDFGLHIHELIGSAGDGPTLGICALIHGNEVAGAYISRDLMNVLRAMSFKGRVLMLPIANPHGFAENERFTTIDRVNLNRVFRAMLQGPSRINSRTTSPENSSPDWMRSSIFIPAPTGQRLTTSTFSTMKACPAPADRITFTDRMTSSWVQARARRPKWAFLPR